MKGKKWYYVPPYKGGNHNVVNDAGEQVALFETRQEAELVVRLYNQHQNNDISEYYIPHFKSAEK